MDHLSKLSKDFWMDTRRRLAELSDSQHHSTWDPIYLAPDESRFQELSFERDTNGDTWLIIDDGGLSVISYYPVRFSDGLDFRLTALRHAETIYRDAEREASFQSSVGGANSTFEVTGDLPQPTVMPPK